MPAKLLPRRPDLTTPVRLFFFNSSDVLIIGIQLLFTDSNVENFVFQTIPWSTILRLRPSGFSGPRLVRFASVKGSR